jgi:hypothetical protein
MSGVIGKDKSEAAKLDGAVKANMTELGYDK